MLKKFIFLILVLQLSQVTAIQYTMSELNVMTIPEIALFLEPTHLNNNGSVAGSAEIMAQTSGKDDAEEQGFILNDTFHLIEGSPIEVMSLNDQDQLVGRIGEQAFIWDKTVGMSIIDTSFPAWATCINNLGDVILVIAPNEDVEESKGFDAYPKEFYFWNVKNGLTRFTTKHLFSKNQIGLPIVLNDKKQVLFNKIKFDQKNDTVHGEGFCVWQDGKVVKQENGFREAHKSLFPVSMNNNGDVACIILTENRKSSSLSFDSVIYSNDGKKIDIAKKSRNVEILHLNDHMQAVGNLGTGKLDEDDDELTLGFIWDKKNGIQDLNTLVKKDSESGSSKAVIRSAIQINNKGQILVKAETEHNTFHAILTPIPE